MICRRCWFVYVFLLWKTEFYIHLTNPANIHKCGQGCGETARVLTHWGRVTHICVSKLTIIGSDNGLSPGRRQAIIRTNAGMLLIGTLGTNFSEIWIEIHAFSFKKMHLKMSSGKWRPFCLSLNVLRGIPMTGAFSEVWGVTSETMSTMTENANRMDIPSESFSPESMGTRNVNVESRASTIDGITIVKR